MYYYFAQFYPSEEGGYGIHFPDLPGCISQGDNLDDAMFMAMDALTGHLEMFLEGGDELPPPSDYETARAKARAYYEEMDMPEKEGTLIMLVPADPSPEPYARLSISMKPRLVAAIDSKAREEGRTRSGLLAEAARRYLHLAPSQN